jgi:hypothetical protein
VNLIHPITSLPIIILYFMDFVKRLVWLIKYKMYNKISIFYELKWVSLFNHSLLFFPLNDPKKALYAKVTEMFNFNLRMSIQKYSIFCSWYNIFSANVSDFYRYFMRKIKNFDLLYLSQQLSYIITFRK